MDLNPANPYRFAAAVEALLAAVDRRMLVASLDITTVDLSSLDRLIVKHSRAVEVASA